MQRIISPLLLSLLCASASVADAAPPVVGGTEVKRGAWPDVVAVFGENAECSGTLIAPDVVLTAGHCIEIHPERVLVDVIDTRHLDGGEVIAVKAAYAYPDWEHSYDVGVLMLDHVAKPKPRVIAAACTADPKLEARAPVTVVGFGLTTPAAMDANSLLHQAELPILDPTCTSDRSCEPAVRPRGEFTAGGRGTDSCFGDSGGPALLSLGDPAGERGGVGDVLVGVVSRGLALPGQPCGNGGVYVRADKVVPWIERTTGRTLAQTTCDGGADDPNASGDGSGSGDGDGDGDAWDAPFGGGCAAGGGGAGLALGLGLMASVWRRRGGRGRGRDEQPLEPAFAASGPVAEAGERAAGGPAVDADAALVLQPRR